MHFESKWKQNSLFQNIGEAETCRQLLTFTNDSNLSKITNFAAQNQEKSREEIEKKKNRKYRSIAALKKYSRRPSKIPL